MSGFCVRFFSGDFKRWRIHPKNSNVRRGKRRRRIFSLNSTQVLRHFERRYEGNDGGSEAASRDLRWRLPVLRVSNSIVDLVGLVGRGVFFSHQRSACRRIGVGCFSGKSFGGHSLFGERRQDSPRCALRPICRDANARFSSLCVGALVSRRHLDCGNCLPLGQSESLGFEPSFRMQGGLRDPS